MLEVLPVNTRQESIPALFPSAMSVFGESPINTNFESSHFGILCYFLMMSTTRGFGFPTIIFSHIKPLPDELVNIFSRAAQNAPFDGILYLD